MTVRGDVETWANALGDELAELREQLADVPTSTGLQPACIQRLRKSFSREQVEIAWQLTVARRKAETKFDCADRMLCDIIGIERTDQGRVAGLQPIEPFQAHRTPGRSSAIIRSAMRSASTG